MCVCSCVSTVRVCVGASVLCWMSGGFVCQEVAVIMLPLRSEVFQGIMSLHVRESAGER